MLNKMKRRPSMKPKLYRVILPVSDIEKASEFYRNLLDVEGERVSSGRHYFNCGGTILACFDPRADGDDFDATSNPEHIYFAVKNLETIHNKIKETECLSVDEEIRIQPWGERSFYARDPFGNPICFVDDETAFVGLK
jgi:catechol 2,3-dioxygenase-like lactoylglutathione lyase family enzyme